MTTLVSELSTVLRRAAVRATLAPSVHNSQPWRLHLTEDRLDVHADLNRQLSVLDPTGRQLYISCGCALMNARISIAASGGSVQVHRLPQPRPSTLIASLTPQDGPADPRLAALDPVIELRQLNRQQFTDDRVPSSVPAILTAAAATEGATFTLIEDPQATAAIAVLSQRAEDIENRNPAYRAELRAWTTDDPARHDGMRDCIEVHGFDTRDPCRQAPRGGSSATQTLGVLCTDGDGPEDWVRAGEALERLLLEISRHDLAASLLTRISEVPATRAELRRQLQLTGYPHLLVRIGHAPPTPASRRRRLVDVLS
ncbi:MAG TPA: hypothetical protein VFU36_05480 [Jatrophihabitans sp.]|nr:hypothetical protein [Jatrophihabitans sp.]